MYGIYDGIIGAANGALGRFDELEELLEYPEVQADKAYYLSILSQYNDLRAVKDKLSELTSSLDEERALAALLSEADTESEKSAIYRELSALKKTQSVLSAAIADLIGCKHVDERAYCRFKLKEGTSRLGVALAALIKLNLRSHGALIEDEKTVTSGGYVQEISFIASGVDVITRLTPLCGAHKVYIDRTRSEELCFAAVPSLPAGDVSDDDLKIDVFHSRGAGGQNVNKVETAVRVTHLPSGLSVVCQDERSQLKNKRRAIETIKKRLKDSAEQTEKKRIEEDINAQYSKSCVSFDLMDGTMTDTRLKSFTKTRFPLTDAQFESYINGLIAL